MIVGVQDAYYNVQNIRRALSFYRDVLGLRVLYESDDWCTLDLGGVRIGLESTEASRSPRMTGRAPH